jgi:hypothetical protein
MIRFGLAIALFFTLLTIGISCLDMNVSIAQIPLRSYLFLFFVLLVVISIGMLIYIWLWPVTLTADGILGHNERGRKQRIKWQEAIYIGTVRVSGQLCHKIVSKDGRQYVLIPTFLRKFNQCASDLLDRGVDFTRPQAPPNIIANAIEPARRRAKPKPLREPIRQGNYIIITTERTPWK